MTGTLKGQKGSRLNRCLVAPQLSYSSEFAFNRGDSDAQFRSDLGDLKSFHATKGNLLQCGIRQRLHSLTTLTQQFISEAVWIARIRNVIKSTALTGIPRLKNGVTSHMPTSAFFCRFAFGQCSHFSQHDGNQNSPQVISALHGFQSPGFRRMDKAVNGTQSQVFLVSGATMLNGQPAANDRQKATVDGVPQCAACAFISRFLNASKNLTEFCGFVVVQNSLVLPGGTLAIVRLALKCKYQVFIVLY